MTEHLYNVKEISCSSSDPNNSLIKTLEKIGFSSSEIQEINSLETKSYTIVSTKSWFDVKTLLPLVGRFNLLHKDFQSMIIENHWQFAEFILNEETKKTTVYLWDPII